MSTGDVISFCRTNKRIHRFCLAEDRVNQSRWKQLTFERFAGTDLLTEKNLKLVSSKYCRTGDEICYNYLTYNELLFLSSTTVVENPEKNIRIEVDPTYQGDVALYADQIWGEIDRMGLETSWPYLRKVASIIIAENLYDEDKLHSIEFSEQIDYQSYINKYIPTIPSA